MNRTPARFVFAVAILVQLCTGIILQVQSTGAIPGDEFQLAGILYSVSGPLSWWAALLCSLAAVYLAIEARGALRRKERARAIQAMLAAAAVIAGIIAPIAHFLAIVLVFFIDENGERQKYSRLSKERLRPLLQFQGALSALRWRDIVKWWAALSVLAGCAALAIALVESFTYTASFAGWLFPKDVLWAYRLRLFDLAITFGATTGLLYVIPMIIDRGLRHDNEDAWRAIFRARISTALVAAGFCGVGLFAVIGDEIVKTGCLVATLVLLSLLFSSLIRLLSRNLVATRFASFAGEPCNRATAWTILFLSVLALPLASIPGRIGEALRKKPTALFSCFFVVALVWEVVLLYLAYPELEDFRSRLILLSVISAVNVFVMAIIAFAFTSKRLRQVEASSRLTTVFALIIAFGFVGSFRPLTGDIALVINEYSRFGFMIKKSSLREIIRPTDSSGSEPASVKFVAHGPGEDHFPLFTPAAIKGKRPPIVVVLWDAARPDHIGAYGYKRNTTPHLDEFAKESVIFERAYSGATATTCGVRHLFTGHYSTRYMLTKTHKPFFIHALRQFGYRRFLITATGTDYNGVSLDSFKRGGPPAESDGSEFRHLALHPKGLDRERPDPEKTENVMRAWRDLVHEGGKSALEGSLTFLHLTGTHFPWKNADPVVDFGDSNIDLYDGETAKVDALTNQAFNTLKELGVYDDAIIILVADHGTGLREHGRWAGFLPYEEQIRIPFIMKIPGVAPRRVQAPVATIDLAPTLVGLFKPGGVNEYDGVSLMPLVMGKTTKTERRYIPSLCAFEDAYSLIEDGRFKLHYHRRENYALLFDLENDPQELVNLYDEYPKDRERLINVMRAFLWRGRKDFGNPYHYRGR